MFLLFYLNSCHAFSKCVPLPYVHRRKNNLAAKRSRDARRSKEDEIAIRAALLEQENLQLKWEMARLRTETGRLRELLLAEDTEEAAGDLSLEI
jgi:hypothetical protein